MKMDYKTLLVILFGVLAFAYVPLLIAAQADSSTVLSAVTGLSTQISTVEDNILSKLSSIDQKMSDLQTTTGTTMQASVNTLTPLLYATIALVVITLVLTVVNLFLLLRKSSPPKEAEKPKEKT
jgi:predicted PurR-regulated permease PerM